MPLSNSRLTESITDTFKAIPLDADALKHCDYTYQTKVDIYDNKCGKGCGYCRIEVDCLKEIKVFHNTDEAIAFCVHTGYKMQRLCEYPSDIVEVHGRLVYPNVTEIVINTCRFWYDALKDEEETEFIEIEEVNEPIRNSGECCIAQVVSQPYPTRTVFR